MRKTTEKMSGCLFVICFLCALIVMAGGCGGSTAENGEETSAVVVTLSPANSSTNILPNTTITASFTDPNSGAGSNLISTPSNWPSVFTLIKSNGDGTNFCTSGSITFADNTATCSPNGLGVGEYTASVDGVTDANGLTIASTATVFSVIRIPGDFNGDGYADLLIGAPGAIPGDSGKAYLYYSSANGVDTTTRITISGAVDSNFGYTVSLRGDFNGDGLNDALIAAPYTGSRGEDRAYVYYGAILPADSPVPNVTFTDGGGTDNFGYALTAGDLNGDGYDDAVIGANGTNSGSGKLYVYYGSAEMDGSVDLTINGASNRLGSSVASGDFDNDGYDDLAAGATNGGHAYIYYGSVSGLSATAAMTLSGVLIGEDADNFGHNMSSADFNGDGYADVLVSANIGASNAGRTYIFYGAVSGLDATADVTITGPSGSNLGLHISSGDFNGDGYADAIISTGAVVGESRDAYVYFGAASMDNSPDVTFLGEGDVEILVSSGDFNRDSFADAVLGFRSTDGRVEIFMGRSDLSGTPSENTSMAGAAAESFGSSVSGGASP